MRRRHRRVHGAKLRARGLKACAGRQPAKYFGHAVLAALYHRCGQVVRAGDNVGDDIRIGGVWNRWFQNSDDGCGANLPHATQPNHLSYYLGIATERGGPELVSEHDRASGARPIVSRVEQAPQHRLETHHFEVGAIDHAGVDFARFAAEPLRREADGGKSAEFADGL